MVKRMILMLITVGILFGGIFGWKAYIGYQTDQAMAAMKPPPVAVTATKVKPMTWTPILTADGSLRATQGVDVTTEVAGIVESLEFESGQTVAAGELLLQLDADQDRANLKELQAAMSLAELQLSRQSRLIEQNATSQGALDEAKSRYQQAVARVESQQALIDKKEIEAPFGGELGIREVDIGEYLSPGAVTVNLQALDPIYADFTLPEQHLGQVRVGQTVKVKVAAQPDIEFKGRITAINPAVNETTRNFAVQATLENDAKKLRPGMFAEVEVVLPEKKDVLTVPQTAITYNPYGDAVFVIDEKHEAGQAPRLTVRQVFVDTGDKRGDQVSIVDGLKARDRVVTTGQIKLQNGAIVRIDNSLKPANEPSTKVVSGNPEA